MANKLGYRPNPLVRANMEAVRSQRKHPIHAELGLVAAFDRIHEWERYPNIACAIESATVRAKNLGFRLEEFCIGKDSEFSHRALRQITARGIRGILLAPTSGHLLRLPFPIEDLSVVSLGQPVENSYVHWVAHNHYQGIQLALRKGNEANYKRIGLAISEDLDQRIGHAWMSAYSLYRCEIIDKGKKGKRLYPFRYKDLNDQALKQWIEAIQPDLILGDDGVIKNLLEKLGLRCPKDIAFMNLNQPPEGAETAGISQNSAKVGSTAMDLLVQKVSLNITGEPTAAITTLLGGEYQPGSTLA